MLLPYFPPDYSGAGAQALKLSLELKKQGVSVSVICTGKSIIPKFEKVGGINVIRVPAFGQEVFRTLLFNIGALLFLLLKMKQFDIIHLHSLNGMYSAVFLRWLAGKKVVFKMTNFGMDDPLSLQKQPGGKLKYFFFKAVDKVVAINSDCLNAYLKANLLSEKCSFIPNGVDVEKFKPLNIQEKIALKKMMGLSEDELVISFLGQISRRKGVHKIVAALKNLATELPDFRCYLVGPAAEKNYFSELKKQIGRDNFEDRFVFPGEVKESQKYLQASDIFVFPSEKEGLPNALLEAMSCGLPCVASNISGCADAIQQGFNGFLFEPDDISSLSKCLAKLAGDENLRQKIGANAIQTIIEKYSLEKISSFYLNLYFELFESRLKALEIELTPNC